MAKPIDQQKLRKLEFQHFDLRTVKVTKDGLKVKFFEKEAFGNQHEIVASGEPHPTFQSALAALTEYYARDLGLLEPWDWAREALLKQPDLLKEAVNGNDRTIARLKVDGIAYLGEAETAGAKLLGSMKCNNNWIKCPTAKIPFAGEKLGYEQTVEKLAEVVRAETYNYIFNNKRAQEDLERQANGGDENDVTATEK